MSDVSLPQTPVATTLVLVAAEHSPGEADLLRTGRQPHPSTPGGVTVWAERLHDELDRRTAPATAADVARVASWLQVQAIGAPLLTVVEPRCDRFAALWSSAAVAAGMEVVLARVDGTEVAAEPVAALPPRHPEPAPDASAWTVPGRGHTVRMWFTDRAESAARRAVRAIQR